MGLRGLVISSGEIRRVQQGAFNMVSGTLLALGKGKGGKKEKALTQIDLVP